MNRIFVLALTLSASAAAVADLRTYEAAYSTMVPKTDGVIGGDPAWETAAWSDGFVMLGTGGEVKSGSRFKALYTDDALYVAVDCSEADMRAIADESNAIEYWRCDVVELFAIPHKDEMIHLVYSARGNANDEIPGGTAKRTRDMIGWAGGSKMLADRWTVEFCVPLNLLGVDPSAKDVTLPFNLCRNAVPPQELSCWSMQKGNASFKDSNIFGRIVLKKCPAAAALSVKKGSLRPHAISLLRRWKTIAADPLWKPVLRETACEASKLDALAAKDSLSPSEADQFAAALASVERREAEARAAKRARIHRELFGD